MLSMLSALIGSHVNQAALVHDYLQICFEDGGILNVYNAFEISGNRGSDLATLSNCTVKDVKAIQDAVTFVFDGDWVLRIGLLDADYRGPEAMEYIGADGGRRIWT